MLKLSAARFLLVASLPLLGAGPPAAPTFTDVSAGSGADGTWVSVSCGAADIDGDGDLDVVVTAVNGGSTRVYRNNGSGVFTDVANSGVGGESQTCLLGDVDNDGLPDLFLGWYWTTSRMFKATGVAIPFTDITGASGTGVNQTWNGTVFGDVDNDGDLDLFICRYPGDNRLLMNNGAGVFSDQAGARGVSDFSPPGGNSKGACFGDLDNDGDLDLFVCKNAGTPRLFLNDGAGFFSEVAGAAGLNFITDASAATLGDIDNDGDLDLYVARWGGCWLVRNNGNGTFTDISVSSGVTGYSGQFGCGFGDYDNDGDLDLFASGGEIGGGPITNVLFRNDGSNVFTEVAAAEGVQDIAIPHGGSIFFDMDGDGDLDLYVPRGNTSGSVGYPNLVYRNETNSTAYLKVRAVGTTSNASAVGAKVLVYDAGHLGDPAFLRGYRQVAAGTGLGACPPAEQHVGLPAATSYDLRVVFPSGIVVDRSGEASGQTLTIVEPTAPIVTSVSSTTANGTYGPGSVLSLTVAFSEAVTVTGAPGLTLETGAADAVAAYAAGSGTSTLTFLYTVQAGHATPDLDCASASALALNGGSIQGSGARNALLTLPAPGASGSLGANKNLVIDTGPPFVTNVSSTAANGTYAAGQTITVTIAFSEPVLVAGTPRLTLETGAADAVVDYVSGSGTSTLSFAYGIQAGQNSPDLDAAGTGALALNGGGLSDAAGNAAALTLPAPGAPASLGANRNLVVDTGAPQVLQVTSPHPDGTYRAGDVLEITVTFSEAVTVAGTPRLRLETGTSDALVDYVSGSGGTVLSFSYAIQAGQASADLDCVSTTALMPNGATLRDGAGNDAVLTLMLPGTPGSLGHGKALVVATSTDLVVGGDCGCLGLDGLLLAGLALLVRRKPRAGSGGRSSPT